MSVILRTMQANYLNVSTDGEAENYALMGVGFTKADESPSAKTTSKQYINQNSAVQTVTSYGWKTSVEADQIKEEAAIQFIINIGENEFIGSQSETDYVVVDLSSYNGAGVYKARKRRVAVQVSDFSSKNGEMGVKANLLAKSDWTVGTFDTSKRTFTEGAGTPVSTIVIPEEHQAE